MKIDDNSLFFTCSLLELIGRTTRQKRSAVTELLGKKVIAHIYANADVLHCEPIAKTADYYIDFCHIPVGDFDNVAACKYAVPSYWDIGKVYARLIEDVAVSDVVDTLFMVYHSAVSDMISNYNSDFFYQSREYIKEYFISNGDSSEIKQRKPAIRFSGFTDAWEQREFSTFAQRKAELGADPELPRVEYEDIVADHGTLNKDVSKKDSRKIGLKFFSGDILFGKLRPYLKNWLLPDFSGLAVGDFWVLTPIKASSEFLYYLIQTPEFFSISNQSAGSKMPRSDWALVSKHEFLLPRKIKEQQKIGMFFRALDDLIALHQRELEKLKKIKQSCLEKMFV